MTLMQLRNTLIALAVAAARGETCWRTNRTTLAKFRIC
jgi:hypothetical protein